ncbi:MAG TPA: succinyldiaminopimelate transaminase [Steroidobacteraceae bacterium]|jgi:N-succinyldiaminopimelate aminotransferase|nr:succinyldiaminopimelate transaminase [Steroidobacteraceae bacterium]
MNPRLASLHPYPFERLRRLINGIQPPKELSPIALWIGEPRHTPPQFLIDALTSALGTLGQYPAALGVPELRQAATQWLERRFKLPAGSVDPQTMLLPVSGTREALFSFVQAVIDPATRPLVMMPNPFYQIYEGAALLAGAEPFYLDALAGNRYLPDLRAVPDAAWRRCQLLFLCSPGNPTGAVMNLDYLAEALELADRYGFVIAADECYADVYLDETSPPPSLLQAARIAGRSRFERCVVFHSLSKRSSVPGLRSGFVAGDAQILQQYLLYRTYHGAAVATHVQLASARAWSDDAHAATNRALYQEKFTQVIPVLEPVLDLHRPDGAFYLWPHVGDDDEAFVRELYAGKNVLVLPGSYMARATDGTNPGRGRVRVSLVASVPDCVTAAQRVRDFMERR